MMKNRNIVLILFLGMIIIGSSFFLHRRKEEWDVAHDFYESHYFSRIETYSDEMLTEHFRHIPEQKIQIDIETLKKLDESYDQKLSHLKEGKLVIEVKEPFREKKIDYDYIEK